MKAGSTVNTLKNSALALALGCVVASAPVQGAVDPIDSCAGIGDASARLACFDRLAQQHRAAVSRPPVPTPSASSAPMPPPDAPASSTKRVDDTVGLDGKQLAIARAKAGIQPEQLPRIVAALAELQQRPGHQYYFRLDNGQVWESTDTQPDLFLRPHQTVTIRPGLFGAFFLKTEEGNSIRVHRLQ
jgi:hypothetical protein